MSQPIRGQGGHLVSLIDPKNTCKLGRGRWDPASCQVLLEFCSVIGFQRRSWKSLSRSEARVAILFFRGPKNTNLVEDVEILLLVKFRILFSRFREKVENVIVNDGRTDDGHFSLWLRCTKNQAKTSAYFESEWEVWKYFPLPKVIGVLTLAADWLCCSIVVIHILLNLFNSPVKVDSGNYITLGNEIWL